MNPIRLVSWYLKLNPYFNRLQELFSMKLSTNVVSQFLLLVIQAANQFGGVIPARYQPIVVLTVGIAQLTVGFLAHFSNTDGTSQKVAKAS